MDGLPAPEVSPDVYDRDYYLVNCAGYEEWSSSDGQSMAARYPGYLDLAGLSAGETLVDIGCGRGELIACAGERGATAIGIEYSQAALDLAEETLAAHGDPAGVSVQMADARSVPVEDASADLVTMLDVIEHLTDAEQTAALAEVARILAPGGRLLIHTMPNRLIYDVTYRLQRALSPRRRREWPADPRNDYERAMHVGEQTAALMRRRLREAGLVDVDVRHGEMIWTGYVPDPRAQVLYHRLAAHRITERFGRADLWGRARRAA